jgi:hypothetical protein
MLSVGARSHLEHLHTILQGFQSATGPALFQCSRRSGWFRHLRRNTGVRETDIAADPPLCTIALAAMATGKQDNASQPMRLRTSRQPRHRLKKSNTFKAKIHPRKKLTNRQSAVENSNAHSVFTVSSSRLRVVRKS